MKLFMMMAMLATTITNAHAYRIFCHKKAMVMGKNGKMHYTNQTLSPDQFELQLSTPIPLNRLPSTGPGTGMGGMTSNEILSGHIRVPNGINPKNGKQMFKYYNYNSVMQRSFRSAMNELRFWGGGITLEIDIFPDRTPWFGRTYSASIRANDIQKKGDIKAMCSFMTF